MKTLTVLLPAAMMADLETESRERHCSKSDIVRELVGSVNGLPADLSRRTKAYLRTTGYGRKRTR